MNLSMALSSFKPLNNFKENLPCRRNYAAIIQSSRMIFSCTLFVHRQALMRKYIFNAQEIL